MASQNLFKEEQGIEYVIQRPAGESKSQDVAEVAEVGHPPQGLLRQGLQAWTWGGRRGNFCRHRLGGGGSSRLGRDNSVAFIHARGVGQGRLASLPSQVQLGPQVDHLKVKDVCVVYVCPQMVDRAQGEGRTRIVL